MLSCRNLPLFSVRLGGFAAAWLACGLSLAAGGREAAAQGGRLQTTASPPPPAARASGSSTGQPPRGAVPSGRSTPIGLPQDAGPHDADAVIEWWYFNSFLATAGGHHYAVVGSFFRTGLAPKSKGHYLIYSLIDLDGHMQTAYSVLDRAELRLLKLYLALAASRNPSDPKPLQLLGILQRDEIPAPHRISGQDAIVKTDPLFTITLENDSMEQTSADARSWKVNLSGEDWTLDLTFDQKERAPMLVGGKGKTGLHNPDDMYYVSLTRMAVEGTLTQGGVVDKVSGPGWIDRQWGSSWAAGNNGWDWFGLQLDDGSDLIVYRVRDNQSGKVLRSDATLLSKDGAQDVDTAPVLAPGTGVAAAPVSPETLAAKSAVWIDPATSISYPQTWSLSMPKLDMTLTTSSVFPEQVIPVLGMGDAIWEGAVTVSGTHGGKPVTGRGFMELVGYRPAVPNSGKTVRLGSEQP